MKAPLTKLPALTLVLAISHLTLAHDSWVEADHPAAAVGEPIQIDLKLGNHGNDHRDFAVRGVVDLDSSTLDLISPAGTCIDLKPELTRVEQDELTWWRSRFRPDQPGIWTIASTSDRVVSYAPKRSIKSAKAVVVVGETDAKPQAVMLGHVLELGMVVDGDKVEVTLWFKGQPLAGHRVSCVPRRTMLKEGFDEAHERLTDNAGRARFTLPRGTMCLIVAHHADDSSGEGYSSTKYSATVTIIASAE